MIRFTCFEASISNMPMMLATINHLYLMILVMVGLIVFFLFVLPAVLRRLIPRTSSNDKTMSWRDRVEWRYRPLSFYYWMFARFKLRMDPMFDELPQFIEHCPDVQTAMDVGCGYGVPGCMMLEFHPEIHVYGIEPNARRAQIASRVYGERGQVWAIPAPWDEPEGFPESVDLVMVIDMIHYLSDESLEKMLSQIRSHMPEGGRLVLRAAMPRPERTTLTWLSGAYDRWAYRDTLSLRPKEQIKTILTRHGFEIQKVVDSGQRREMAWLIGRAVGN